MTTVTVSGSSPGFSITRFHAHASLRIVPSSVISPSRSTSRVIYSPTTKSPTSAILCRSRPEQKSGGISFLDCTAYYSPSSPSFATSLHDLYLRCECAKRSSITELDPITSQSLRWSLLRFYSARGIPGWRCAESDTLENIMKY